jgi:hypothetical protein
MDTRIFLTSLLSLFVLILSGCNVAAIRGSGHVVSENRAVSDFNRVELLGSGDVILTQGDAEALKVEAEDNLLTYLRTEVRDHTLYLGLTDKDGQAVIFPTRPIKYYVSLKTIAGLKLSGSGNMDAQKLSAETLALDITGSGNIHLGALNAQAVQSTISGSGKCELGQGTVPAQRVEISGSGNYRSENLAGQTVAVRITGSGAATVWAESTLEAQVTGSGDVHYYGTPQVTQQVTGSGRVQAEGKR